MKTHVTMKIEVSAETAAYISLKYARTGDMSFIAQRLNMLSELERQFLADYLEGKVKPRKLKGDLTPFGKAAIRWHVVTLRAKDWKQEAAVQEACQGFGIKRRYVFELLKGIDYPKRIARMLAGEKSPIRVGKDG